MKYSKVCIDEEVVSPNVVDMISSEQVFRIKKNIN